MPHLEPIAPRRDLSDEVLPIEIRDGMIRMLGNGDVGAHPRMDFADNLREARANKGFAAYPAGIKTHVKIRLAILETSMSRVENGICVLKQQELADARYEDVGNKPALCVIQLVDSLFFDRFSPGNPFERHNRIPNPPARSYHQAFIRDLLADLLELENLQGGEFRCLPLQFYAPPDAAAIFNNDLVISRRERG